VQTVTAVHSSGLHCGRGGCACESDAHSQRRDAAAQGGGGDGDRPAAAALPSAWAPCSASHGGEQGQRVRLGQRWCRPVVQELLPPSGHHGLLEGLGPVSDVAQGPAARLGDRSDLGVCSKGCDDRRNATSVHDGLLEGLGSNGDVARAQQPCSATAATPELAWRAAMIAGTPPASTTACVRASDPAAMLTRAQQPAWATAATSECARRAAMIAGTPPASTTACWRASDPSAMLHKAQQPASVTSASLACARRAATIARTPPHATAA